MQEFVVELDQSELTKISEYVKWMDSMPLSIKHDGSIQSVEYAIFGYLGFEDVLERAIDVAGIMDWNSYWWDDYHAITSISDDNKLTTTFLSDTATQIKVTYIAK